MSTEGFLNITVLEDLNTTKSMLKTISSVNKIRLKTYISALS